MSKALPSDGHDLEACIWFDAKTRELLAVSAISLEEILRQAKVEGLAVGQDPTAPQGAKDIFPVQIGSATVVAAATPIIIKLIERLTLTTMVVDEIQIEAVRDASGDVVRDIRGHPILVKQKRKRLLEATPPKESNRQISITVPGGIQIGITDRQKA